MFAVTHFINDARVFLPLITITSNTIYEFCGVIARWLGLFINYLSAPVSKLVSLIFQNTYIIEVTRIQLMWGVILFFMTCIFIYDYLMQVYIYYSCLVDKVSALEKRLEDAEILNASYRDKCDVAISNCRASNTNLHRIMNAKFDLYYMNNSEGGL